MSLFSQTSASASSSPASLPASPAANRVSSTPERHVWQARGHTALGYGALAVLVLGLGAWSTLTTIQGAVVGSGTVEVETNRQVVQHQAGGIVQDLLVKEGDVVQPGQVLLRMDEKLDQSELTIIENQLFSLLGNAGRLTAEQDGKSEISFDPELVERAKTDSHVREIIEGQRNLLQARQENRDKQVGQLQERKHQTAQQIEGLNAKLNALRQQRQLISEELAVQQKLLRDGLTQTSKVMTLQRSEVEADGEIASSMASIAESRAKIAEIEIAILNVSGELREQSITDLRNAEAQIAELRQKRVSSLETLGRTEVTAPTGGVVFGLTVHALRTVVKAAEPILYIIPQNVGLVITTNLPPNEIDQVHVGQKADLVFAAFDRRQTPDIHGTVIEVSADVFNDEKTGNSFYKAKIRPDEQEIARLGDVQVLPGMPVETFIQTTERSPFTYLTKPLASYFNKAFRER
ncbi:HlyD family type I secretion periplasmic adaptor subunit [Agrobacterium vitis]|uniref:HlyD family type I secretion periplasmic adaptor subunit n=1 Tax=Allorhizobium ampelinum TaxID=3025782 RepID=UPI001F16F1C3|nr:HlyD family type I secretion periplasmic adaptor subunit [Allorhizobium ampelinum]MCF1460205.1 HlyD family type I secretion periplasmic adaptor subunit [Allorhizobium ampelinum]